MKVIMKATTFSDGQTYQRGETYDVESIRAAGWLDRGLAQEPPARRVRWTPAPKPVELDPEPEPEQDADTTDEKDQGHAD